MACQQAVLVLLRLLGNFDWPQLLLALFIFPPTPLQTNYLSYLSLISLSLISLSLFLSLSLSLSLSIYLSLSLSPPSHLWPHPVHAQKSFVCRMAATLKLFQFCLFVCFACLAIAAICESNLKVTLRLGGRKDPPGKLELKALAVSHVFSWMRGTFRFDDTPNRFWLFLLIINGSTGQK